MSRGVPCREATRAPIDGWEVIPLIESTATSTASAPRKLSMLLLIGHSCFFVVVSVLILGCFVCCSGGNNSVIGIITDEVEIVSVVLLLFCLLLSCYVVSYCSGCT